MTDLVARTRRLDAPVDLLAVAGRDGLLIERSGTGLAGRGCATRLPWPAGDPGAAASTVARALSAIDTDDEVGAPGCGPVAFGTLPFTPGVGAELVVPALVVGMAEDGTRWLTTIGPPGDPVHDTVRAPAPEPPTTPPRRVAVAAPRDPEDWCALVERATKMLAEGTMDKVVLARELTVTADRPLDALAVLGHLRARYPGCHLVSVAGLIAASPEMLVSRRGEVVRAQPMAGTTPRGGDPAADQRLAGALLSSTKDRHEHQITIDMVHDTLLPWCSYLDYEAAPSVVAVANVQHLATLVEGHLSRPAPSVLELVAALHPTPAVAGSPRDDAVRWIAEHEALDRARYGGTAGWADARGNGTWCVAVRTAELAGPVARVLAGVGVVADSDPAAELAETSAKLEALLTALVRP